MLEKHKFNISAIAPNAFKIATHYVIKKCTIREKAKKGFKIVLIYFFGSVNKRKQWNRVEGFCSRTWDMSLSLTLFINSLSKKVRFQGHPRLS